MSATQFIIRVHHHLCAPEGKHVVQARTPDKVRRDGYGFTLEAAEAWIFPSQKKAEAKAFIIAHHMSWPMSCFTVEPLQTSGNKTDTAVAVAPTWQAGEPPRDGQTYVAMGRVISFEDSFVQSTPFLSEVRWKESSLWVDSRGMSIAYDITDEIRFDFWISRPQAS